MSAGRDQLFGIQRRYRVVPLDGLEVRIRSLSARELLIAEDDDEPATVAARLMVQGVVDEDDRCVFELGDAPRIANEMDGHVVMTVANAIRDLCGRLTLEDAEKN